MSARVVQLSVSSGGLPKLPVSGGLVTLEGLEGDRHAHPKIHGGPDKAILLASAEIIEQLKAAGYPLFYGALGENLTTQGLDLRSLRLGERLRVGGALLELTQPRGPCLQLDVYGPSLKTAIYDEQVRRRDPASARWGMSGCYARVLEPGRIEPGDIIAIVAKAA